MRADRKALVMVFGLTVVMFWPLLAGRFYAVGDTRDVFVPIETFYREQQLIGKLPAWMPNASFGFPVVAAAQIGFFYPPLLVARVLPVRVYLPFLIIAHYFMLAAGTYFLARTLRRTKSAASLAAVSFAFGGFCLLHLTHLNIIFAIAYLPWQLWLSHWVMSKEKKKLADIAGLILISTMPWLAGQMQIPLLITVVTAVWLFYLGYKNKTPYAKITALVAFIAAGILLTAAVQILPTWELAKQTRLTDAGFSIERANQHSYPLYHLPTLLFPRFYNNDNLYWGKRLQIEYGFYTGTWPLLLAGLAIYARKKWLWTVEDRSIINFLTGLLVIPFLLALGDLSPFRLMGIEPSLWFFSAPARWLLFSSLAMSLLAAYGYDGWQINKWQHRTTAIRWLILMVIVIIIANVLMFYYADEFIKALNFSTQGKEKISSMMQSARMSSLSYKSIYLYLPLLAIGAGAINGRLRVRKMILIVTGLELLALGINLTPSLSGRDVFAPPQSIQILPADVRSRQARTLSMSEGGDTGAYFTDPQSRADGKKREAQRQLLVPLSASQFGLAGAEWPASLNLTEQEIVLDKVKHCVGDTKQNSRQLCDKQAAEELNIGAVLTERAGKLVIDKLQPKPRAELINVTTNETKAMAYPTLEADSLFFKVDNEQDEILVVRDTFYPGWQARVDGRPVVIEKYHDIFKSVKVPAGAREVQLYYRPVLLHSGLFITVVFASGLMASLLWKFSRR